jgi:hypothetical protein
MGASAWEQKGIVSLIPVSIRIFLFQTVVIVRRVPLWQTPLKIVLDVYIFPVIHDLTNFAMRLSSPEF